MSRKTIYLNQKRIKLDPTQLIQSGGEGMVFAFGNTAVKLYHQPQPHHEARLQHLLDTGLARQLPPNVLAPCALIRNGRRQVIGFQMPLLPRSALPFKKLANPLFWKQAHVPAARVVALLIEIHRTLTRLHQLGIVTGDLNDHNLFFDPAQSLGPTAGAKPATFWIDADSYQFGRFPCPVAMQAFLDPALYGVADFNARPYFTPLTDWYAYAVLLVKSLLQAHPYSGAHSKHKALKTRAAAGISLMNPAVIYPSLARPLECLSDALLHHLHLIFENGKRLPFPLRLLNDYQANLITCSRCSLAYDRQRPHCPGCQRPKPLLHPSPSSDQQKRPRLLLETDGLIEKVSIRPDGRIWAVARCGDQYRLLRAGIGGKLDETPLFNGRPGYRFVLFDHHLAVNPPGGTQLLILDIGGARPRQVAMLQTGTFRDTAVFAATPRHLFRIAGSWVMRGSIRDGLYVEAPIATAHLAQTRFFASPHEDVLAGYHRIFAEHRFFVLDARGANYDVPIPAPASGESIIDTAVVFDRRALAFILKIRSGGRFRLDAYLCTPHGEITSRDSEAADPVTELPLALQPAMLNRRLPGHAAAPVALLHHPAGLLLQEANRLWVIPS
ncbi:MAG: hypothetical protein ACE5E7_12765 [Anaerolineae bacterium]